MNALLKQAKEILERLESQDLKPGDIRDSSMALEMALLGLALSTLRRIETLLQHMQKAENLLLSDTRLSAMSNRQLLEVYQALNQNTVKFVEQLQSVSKNLDFSKLESYLLERSLTEEDKVSLNEEDLEELVKKAYPSS